MTIGPIDIRDHEKSRGDQWVSHLLKFSKLDQKWAIDTASLRTPAKINPDVTDGVFYCKVVAPSRVMEWLLLDSLK